MTQGEMFEQVFEGKNAEFFAKQIATQGRNAC
jgi:hypothetical protein